MYLGTVFVVRKTRVIAIKIRNYMKTMIKLTGINRACRETVIPSCCFLTMRHKSKIYIRQTWNLMKQNRNMKRINLLMVLLAMCFSLQAQYRITGKVTDENKDPIPGGSVVFVQDDS